MEELFEFEGFLGFLGFLRFLVSESTEPAAFRVVARELSPIIHMLLYLVEFTRTIK
jgi:hypothetical protein